MSKRQYEPSTADWFVDFAQGRVSPTDAVLSPVERRLLPPCTSPSRATVAAPFCAHTTLGFGCETSAVGVASPLLARDRTIALWMRTEPAAVGAARLIRVGCGASTWRGGCGGAASSAAAGSSVATPSSAASPAADARVGAGIRRDSGNAATKPAGADDAGSSTSSGAAAAADGLRSSNRRTPVSYGPSASRVGVFAEMCGGRVVGWAAGATLAGSDDDDADAPGASPGWQLAVQTSALRTGLAFLRVACRVPRWLGGQLLATDVVSLYVSGSYQQDPSFVMVRGNLCVPVTDATELSVSCDPLRRWQLSLCTQLNRRANAAVRIRLNSISWRDAGVDVGAMINGGTALGRPLRLGMQSAQTALGRTLHLFADVSEALPPSSSSSSATLQAAAASSWLSALRSMRVGIVISRLWSGRAGTDVFIRCEF